MKNRVLFIAVSLALSILLYACSYTSDSEQANVKTSNAADKEIMAKSVVVNIEGKIVAVSENGKSFLLDTGKWVEVTKDTELGITGPTAAPKDEQFFEESFRVGNSIVGFTLDENAKKLKAYAIYTNWNWEKPLSKK